MTTPEKRIIHRPTNRSLVWLLLLLALALGAAAWWFLLRPVPSEAPVTMAVPAPSPLPQPPAAETPATSAPPATAPAPVAKAGQQPPAEADECQQLRKEIQGFFTRLDREDYIAPRQLSGGTQAYVGRLLDKLFANPPLVVGETNTFLSMLGNTFHFYRILKKDDVLLVKDILLNESENIEPLMALFYRWSLKAPECGSRELHLAMPLPGLYEYAGFFLNTLGGRSYLFRRESRLRLLVKYYSLLVLDRANSERLNSHGIDIRPPLATLSEEMRNARNLKGRTEYLATLAALQGRYRPTGMAKTATMPH
ncbi:MAG: hypothetical protein ACOY8P_01080 [Thermodesulfobacteriota bacterium]